ncbi:acyltransferase [Anabaena sp. UHCC 0451]|uniref:acyltransferase family protein n=1 Tax=Anabaena sp. UHCC 0451 TaxID=2055235 RepID=UPI002B20207D|nr:acyltransferase [Anabaena sp. UHCC 0451]MEA5575964.1 acyltransferase [Anabaena sp. UHCC 0451]
MFIKYDSNTTPQKQGYIPALDGIRAIAILLVLFAHSVIFDQFTWLRSIGFQLGLFGVSIFFVLSGYLITRLLIQEEEQTGNISLKFFYIRRAFRLLPALYLYLFVVWVLWIMGLLPDNPWHSFISSLLYIRNLIGRGDATNHIWSLSFEQQFYFLWPITITLFRQQNIRRLVIAFILILTVVVWRCYAITNNLATYGDVYIRTDFRLDSPLIGCAIAIIEKIKPRLIIRFNSSPFRSDMLLITAIMLMICWMTIQLQIGIVWSIDSTITSLIAGIVVISQIVHYDSFGKRFLTLPPLIFIGKISYGLYLWQGLFLGLQVGAFGVMRKFPIDLILSFSSALISYFFLEKRLLKIKDKKFHK